MANRITEVQTHFGLDDAALATRLGVHRTTISRWKKGEVAISGPAMKLLDRMLSKAKPPLPRAHSGEVAA